jgi:hypothetical protein
VQKQWSHARYLTNKFVYRDKSDNHHRCAHQSDSSQKVNNLARVKARQRDTKAPADLKLLFKLPKSPTFNLDLTTYALCADWLSVKEKAKAGHGVKALRKGKLDAQE